MKNRFSASPNFIPNLMRFLDNVSNFRLLAKGVTAPASAPISGVALKQRGFL
jgi:hypothetical protein